MQHFENYCIYDFELELWAQTKSLFENQFVPGPIKEKFWVQFFFKVSLQYFEKFWAALRRF